MEEEENNQDEETIMQSQCFICKGFRLQLLDWDTDEVGSVIINLLCMDCGVLQQCSIERHIVNLETKPYKPLRKKK